MGKTVADTCRLCLTKNETANHPELYWHTAAKVNF